MRLRINIIVFILHSMPHMEITFLIMEHTRYFHARVKHSYESLPKGPFLIITVLKLSLCYGYIPLIGFSSYSLFTLKQANMKKYS